MATQDRPELPPARPSAEPPARGPRFERAWVVIGVVLVGAAAMALLGAIMAPERHSDMWLELVKSSIQIIVLAVAGGVVGARAPGS